jgi:hypothetical protein
MSYVFFMLILPCQFCHDCVSSAANKFFIRSLWPNSLCFQIAANLELKANLYLYFNFALLVFWVVLFFFPTIGKGQLTQYIGNAHVMRAATAQTDSQ